MSHRYLTTRREGRRLLIATVAAFAMVLAGCSSSSSTGGGSRLRRWRREPAAAPSGSGLAPARPRRARHRAANPVVVGVMYTDHNPLGISPEIKGAAIAAEQYINAHGGIGGQGTEGRAAATA